MSAQRLALLFDYLGLRHTKLKQVQKQRDPFENYPMQDENNSKYQLKLVTA